MRERFERAYVTALKAFLDQEGEAGLKEAYELGRQAVDAGLGVLDLAGLHHQAILAALEDGRTSPPEGPAAAMPFFIESLSAFEMVQRGFREARQMALVEKRHADQLRRLAEASLAVGSTLSLADLAEVIPDRAREVVGAECCYILIDENDGAPPPPPRGTLCETCQTYLEATDRAALQETLSGQEAWSISGNELRRLGPWPEEEDRDPGTAVALAAPLLARGGRTLGGLYLFHGSGEGFSESDRSVVIQLAQMVAAALENGFLYERERRIAETLQRALLPRKLPRFRDVELAARYRPGAAGLNVGGDWYDVVSLGKDRFGVAIGDIAGRGVRAASSMGQARMAFRAYTLEEGPPEAVVGRMNRLMSLLDSGHFSTLAYVVIDTAHRLLRAISAGHPPPLLHDGEGTRYLEQETRAIPLGVDAGRVFHPIEVSFRPGALLFLYTDGLLGRQIDSSLERLAEAVRSGPADLEALCDHVLEALVEPGWDDDVALVALRLGDREGGA